MVNDTLDFQVRLSRQFRPQNRLSDGLKVPF